MEDPTHSSAILWFSGNFPTEFRRIYPRVRLALQRVARQQQTITISSQKKIITILLDTCCSEYKASSRFVTRSWRWHNLILNCNGGINHSTDWNCTETRCWNCITKSVRGTLCRWLTNNDWRNVSVEFVSKLFLPSNRHLSLFLSISTTLHCGTVFYHYRCCYYFNTSNRLWKWWFVRSVQCGP